MPTGLLKAVFFYDGKNFCLHRREEHCSLRISQLKRETTVANGKSLASYVYEEFGPKNNQGGIALLNLVR